MARAITLKQRRGFLMARAITLKQRWGFLMARAITLKQRWGFLMARAITLRQRRGFLMARAITLRQRWGFLMARATPFGSWLPEAFSAIESDGPPRRQSALLRHRSDQLPWLPASHGARAAGGAPAREEAFLRRPDGRDPSRTRPGTRAVLREPPRAIGKARRPDRQSKSDSICRHARGNEPGRGRCGPGPAGASSVGGVGGCSSSRAWRKPLRPLAVRARGDEAREGDPRRDADSAVSLRGSAGRASRHSPRGAARRRSRPELRAGVLPLRGVPRILPAGPQELRRGSRKAAAGVDRRGNPLPRASPSLRCLQLVFVVREALGPR